MFVFHTTKIRKGQGEQSERRGGYERLGFGKWIEGENNFSKGKKEKKKKRNGEKEREVQGGEKREKGNGSAAFDKVSLSLFSHYGMENPLVGSNETPRARIFQSMAVSLQGFL